MLRAPAIWILLLISISGRAQIYTDILQLKLDSVFSSITEKEPGVSIHIEQGNQLLYSHSYGSSNLQEGEKFNSLTLSNIGSLSKVFIAYSILILQEQGKLTIEDSIYKYIPDFKNKEFAQKIRIRHLLTHTSGIKDLPASAMDSVFSLNMNDEQNFERVKYVNTLAFEPGNNFHYSDQAFSALVLIVEKVSKMKWQEFVKQSIFAKAGMTFTKFTEGTIENKGVAHGYRFQKNNYIEYDQMECPKMFTATNAGIWTNIEDLRKFMYAIKYCLFLNCETIKLSEELQVPQNWYSPHPPPHNLCWFTDQPYGKDKSIHCSGSIGGFRSQMVFYPDKDLTIIWLSNNSKDYSEPILSQLYKLKFIK